MEGSSATGSYSYICIINPHTDSGPLYWTLTVITKPDTEQKTNTRTYAYAVCIPAGSVNFMLSIVSELNVIYYVYNLHNIRKLYKYVYAKVCQKLHKEEERNSYN